MLINQVTPIYITSSQITNFTSDRSISSGSTEMLISALSKMAIRSGGVRYVAFGPDIQNVLTLQGAHPNNKTFRAPDFFIRGGLTEFNKSLWNAQNGVGTSVEMNGGNIQSAGLSFLVRKKKDITKSISLDASFGTLTMDLNAGFVSDLQMIPGVSSSNTLAMQNRAGKSITGDISLANLGLSYSLSDNVSEDFNEVMRSLIQVGAIEIVGKLQGVPYWRCLANAGMVEQKDQELQKAFIERSTKDEVELIRSAQTALRDLKYYKGELNGRLDYATQEGLQAYQQQMGLLATGHLTYETFRMLNIYTPARTSPYVPWWQNYNLVERAVAGPRVSAPAAPAAPAAAAPARMPAAAEAMPEKAKQGGVLVRAASGQTAAVAAAAGSIPEAWKKFGPLTQQRLQQSRAWLVQTPLNHWFIQLLRTDGGQTSGIEVFIQKAEAGLGADMLHAYTAVVSGTEYVGVIYGDFASEPEALSALRNLPREVRDYQPYVRAVSSLRGNEDEMQLK
jgi:peptidoglycan hydrolase-like protein with peptidoglycan-binding domain